MQEESSGGSKISQMVALTPKVRSQTFLPKNCIEFLKFGPGRDAFLRPPLDPGFPKGWIGKPKCEVANLLFWPFSPKMHELKKKLDQGKASPVPP